MKYILLCVLLSACAHSQRPKNHIMFIVDGMGPAHISGARLYKGGPEARLALESLPYTGIVRTASTNDFVTDSAASATAYATGVRTYNRSIGMTDAKVDPSGNSQKLISLLKKAQEKGKSVGIVTSTRITHATPAAYYANVPNRNMEQEIADQLLAAKVDVVIGGGAQFFKHASEGGKRRDARNLFQEFEKAGYAVARTDDELFQLNDNRPVLALLDDDHLPYDLEREAGQKELKDYVEFAIKRLSKNPKGYFLLVEAGRVDHASHFNQARLAFGDMLAFDRALEFTLSQKKNTLIIATADHETGGLSLNGYAPYQNASGERLLKNHIRDLVQDKYNYGFIAWGTGPGFHSPLKVDESVVNFQHKATYETPVAFHTAVDVPVMAIGPGAKNFTGFFDIEEISQIAARLLGIDLNQ